MPGRPLPACRRRRPRWVRISARPLASRPPWPSGCTKPWAPRMSVISWLPLLRPTRLRASASTTPLPRPPPGSLPVWVGSPLTGRVSHPLDDKQSFMMSSHHHSPLTSLAWSHRAPTPHRGDGSVRQIGGRPDNLGSVIVLLVCHPLSIALWAIEPRHSSNRIL